MDVLYREATPNDLDGIYYVEKQCFNIPWSKLSIKIDLCENSSAVYLVAVINNRIVGFCGTHVILNEGHIMNVAVMPKYRRLGIGKTLVEKMFSMTKPRVDAYTLEVRVSNIAAIAMYEELGFVAAGTRPSYYSDTGEDALIMWAFHPDNPANKNIP